MTNPLITDAVLHDLGFRKQWTQDTRRPNHVLWLGDSRHHQTGSDDVGLELSEVVTSAPSDDPKWYCWMRSDTISSRGRFCFVRFLRKRQDVIALIEAITGESYTRERIELGCFRYPGQAMERDAQVEADE